MTENENMTKLMELVTKVKELQIQIDELQNKESKKATESKLQIQEPDSDSDSDSSIVSPYIPDDRTRQLQYVRRELTERERIIVSIRKQMDYEEDINGGRTWGIPDDNHSQTTGELDDAYEAEELRRYDEIMATKESDSKFL